MVKKAHDPVSIVRGFVPTYVITRPFTVQRAMNLQGIKLAAYLVVLPEQIRSDRGQAKRMPTQIQQRV